jgi:hypothetical protein
MMSLKQRKIRLTLVSLLAMFAIAVAVSYLLFPLDIVEVTVVGQAAQYRFLCIAYKCQGEWSCANWYGWKVHYFTMDPGSCSISSNWSIAPTAGRRPKLAQWRSCDKLGIVAVDSVGDELFWELYEDDYTFRRGCWPFTDAALQITLPSKAPAGSIPADLQTHLADAIRRARGPSTR